jgi:hypothetical protein
MIDWFNNGVIDSETMTGILKYFIDNGYCIETELI